METYIFFLKCFHALFNIILYVGTKKKSNRQFSENIIFAALFYSFSSILFDNSYAKYMEPLVKTEKLDVKMEFVIGRK